MPEIEEEKDDVAEEEDEVITSKDDIEGEEETPSPSSGEEKPKEESEEEEKSEEEPQKAPTQESGQAETEGEEKPAEKQPEKVDDSHLTKPRGKPVEGETPRERAYRLELERAKAANRKLRGQKLLGDAQPQAASQAADLSDEDKKALEAYDPEQVQNLEKVFGVLAKKHGYVRKDEFTKQNYQNTSQDVFDDWMEKHPEYSEDNDPKGILWNRFKEEFDQYKKPENPKTYVKIFNKIHNEIFGITTQPKESVAQAQAKQEKIKVASAGTKPSAASKKTSEIRKSHTEQDLSNLARGGAMKGFTAEELDEMGL